MAIQGTGLCSAVGNMSELKIKIKNCLKPSSALGIKPFVTGDIRCCCFNGHLQPIIKSLHFFTCGNPLPSVQRIALTW